MTRDLHANQQPARIFQRIFYFSISREVIWATPKSTKQTCTVRRHLPSDLLTAGAAHGENERRSWAKHLVSRAAYEPGVWCLWALPPGMECQDGCPVNFSKHFSALFFSTFLVGSSRQRREGGLPAGWRVRMVMPQFFVNFFLHFFLHFFRRHASGMEGGDQNGGSNAVS